MVFESDDWGSLRISSNEIYDLLTRAGLDLTSGDSGRYNQLDTLESEDDLDALFSTLGRYKDIQGNHPVFTAYCLVANPNFEEIEANKFLSYDCESVVSTFERENGSSQAINLWVQGAQRKLFAPEFHGREHLNVPQWMKALQLNDEQARLAFRHQVWGFNNKNQFNISYQAAFDVGELEDVDIHASIVEDGLKRFEQLMGYCAAAFVPPNGILHASLYPVSAKSGIEYVFSAQRNRIALGKGRYRTSWNYLGKQNSSGQRFIIRNCFFEPTASTGDPVRQCIQQIGLAFAGRRPAIIGTHRVNFVGGRNPNNRKEGLRKLSMLLNNVLEKWPDIEFLTTRQLGKLITSRE